MGGRTRVLARFGLPVRRAGARACKHEPARGPRRLALQIDGNLVFYDDELGVALWSAGKQRSAAGQALMQNDGNSVVYDAGGGALWSTGTVGNPGARLAIQDDGNLVVYRADGQVCGRDSFASRHRGSYRYLDLGRQRHPRWRR